MKLIHIIRTQKERVLWIAFALFMGTILGTLYAFGLIKG